MNRREWIGGTLALGVACTSRRGNERPATEGEHVVHDRAAVSPGHTRPDDGRLDEVLEQLHAEEPRSKQGLSTHAPMVAEALCELGFADRARSWVARYRAPMIEIPTAHQPIDRQRWRDALGPKRGAATWEAELAHFGDWRALFDTELRDASWRDVLDRWALRLAPGISAAATHGVIRTAHAARALGRKETAPRTHELARGLAYWAAAYEELPGGAPPRGSPPSELAASLDAALAALPRYRKVHGDAPRGNIVSGLRAVGTLDRFAPAKLAFDADVGAALSTLSATFARVYLEHGAHHRIAFAHAVTGPCALRRIAPHVTPETARAALPYAWHAAAAIFSAYAGDQPVAIAPTTLGTRDLAARSVENGNDHAIKLVEVLLAEHAIRPDPIYLAAAEDAAAKL